MLSAYAKPIAWACILFLPVAAFLTLPFMIYHYRRYGSIPFLRVLVVYSFVLYMMCAFFLTALPLPDYDVVARMKPKPIQWIPFSSYIDVLKDAGFSLHRLESLVDIACWKKLLTSSGLFEILANIVMTVPLGIYLRYYFRRSWKQTLLIGFLVSLFFEVTQLTGLWFIYPKAYRIASVDDLFDNTLGTMIGFLLAPLICSLLPSREELDRQAIGRMRRITLTRRITAAVIDWLIFLMLSAALLILLPKDSGVFTVVIFFGYLIWVILVSVILQRITGGRTVGKALLRIALRDADTQKAPTLVQLIKRYFILYIVEPFLLLIVLFGALMMGILVVYEDQTFRLIGIIGGFLIIGGFILWLVLILSRHKELPHSYRSHTRIILDPKLQSALREAEAQTNAE